MKNPIYLLALIYLLTLSCKTKQKPSELNYMQNIEQAAIESVSKNAITILRPGDQLVITISGRDSNVLAPFNQNYSSSNIIRSATSGNLNPTQTSTTGPTYIVNSSGNIDFPVFGSIEAEGKTIDDLRNEIKSRLKKYIKTQTSVNIQLVNFEVAIFGEVNRANKYRFEDTANPTILDAIALAGDLTMYGKRDDILVIRHQDGNVIQGRVNLKDANFINSPFYYLQQGDAIVVSANNNKEIQARTNPNTGVYISIASVALTAIALILSLKK